MKRVCDQVFNCVLGHALLEHAIAGSLLWMTAAGSYPDYDGFTVYLSTAMGRSAAPSTHVAADDGLTVYLVVKHAGDMAALNAPVFTAGAPVAIGDAPEAVADAPVDVQ